MLGGNIAGFVNLKEIETPTQAGYAVDDEIYEAIGTEGNSKAGVDPLDGAAIGLICAAAIALLRRRSKDVWLLNQITLSQC